MNIYDYIEKYKTKTYEEKEFNEIDNIIFSLLAYLDFSNIIEKNETLETVAKKYLEKYSFKEIKKLGTSPKDAYICLEKIYKTKRYKNIILKNYIYRNTTRTIQCNNI